VSGYITIASDRSVETAAVSLPTYRALIEYCRQQNAAEELVDALAAATPSEPLILPQTVKPELLRMVGLWLDGLAVGAWPHGLHELRLNLQREHANGDWSTIRDGQADNTPSTSKVVCQPSSPVTGQ
jgi:hypothetical protein